MGDRRHGCSPALQPFFLLISLIVHIQSAINHWHAQGMHAHSFAVTSDRRKTPSISIGQYVRSRYPPPRKYPGPLGAIYEELYWLFRQVSFWLRYDWQTNELEDLDIQQVHRRPDDIEALILSTKYNRTELKRLYRNFKQEFPTGAITLERFRQIYTKNFSRRGSSVSKYPEFLFKAFDADGDGQIGFGELITGLSVLSRGSPEEKLGWLFHLYDFNRSGRISHDDLQTAVGSIFDLLGRYVWPPFHSQTISRRVYEMQEKMDLDHDGFICKEEFISACLQDPVIVESLEAF